MRSLFSSFIVAATFTLLCFAALGGLGGCASTPGQKATVCDVARDITLGSNVAYAAVEGMIQASPDQAVKKKGWAAQWYIDDQIANTLVPQLCPAATVAATTQPAK